MGGLDLLILELLGGAELDQPSHARLGVRGAACHPVGGGGIFGRCGDWLFLGWRGIWAGHCLGGGTVPAGGGDAGGALPDLLAGRGPNKVRRASRSSPSNCTIFSAPKPRSAVTRWSRGACMKALRAVLVAIARQGKAEQGRALQKRRKQS